MLYTQVYGYGGVGIIVEVLTDKVNRSVAAVREVVKDCGGKMADSGSIMFKFRRARVANIKVTDVDRDQLLTIALDAGAEDIIEPSMDDYDTEANSSERFIILCLCIFIKASLRQYLVNKVICNLRDRTAALLQLFVDQ